MIGNIGNEWSAQCDLGFRNQAIIKLPDEYGMVL